MQRISVTLPDDVVQRFHAKVEKGERSKFITNAIKEALQKEEKWKAFQSLTQFKPFAVFRDSTEVLREIREKGPKETLEEKQ
ncbi:MAG: hypothetical protein HQM14_06475 [SAR324 cluster bacterium]|nr:hypothetical protein [SAR324 cluster bacterium]